jgi:hypothetical protein
MLRHQQF